MTITSAAYKYAAALSEVADASASEGELLEELQQFTTLFHQHRDLDEALQNPALPFQSKRKIVEEIGRRSGMSEAVRNLILVLLQNGRIRQIREVTEAYGRILDDQAGVIQVEVSSARELSVGTRERLEKVLEEMTGMNVRCRYSVQEALIGGLRLKIGSQVYDGTIQTQLEEIWRRIRT